MKQRILLSYKQPRKIDSEEYLAALRLYLKLRVEWTSFHLVVTGYGRQIDLHGTVIYFCNHVKLRHRSCFNKQVRTSSNQK